MFNWIWPARSTLNVIFVVWSPICMHHQQKYPNDVEWTTEHEISINLDIAADKHNLDWIISEAS